MCKASSLPSVSCWFFEKTTTCARWTLYLMGIVRGACIFFFDFITLISKEILLQERASHFLRKTIQCKKTNDKCLMWVPSIWFDLISQTQEIIFKLRVCDVTKGISKALGIKSLRSRLMEVFLGLTDCQLHYLPELIWSQLCFYAGVETKGRPWGRLLCQSALKRLRTFTLIWNGPFLFRKALFLG